MTTPQSTCLRNDSSYGDLHGQRTAAEGRGAGVTDNQSNHLPVPSTSPAEVLKCCEKKVVNEKLLQSMYKHQEAQKKFINAMHTQYPTNTKRPQNKCTPTDYS